MGRNVFTRSMYTAAVTKEVGDLKVNVTKRAEAQAHSTGKLNPLVDPSEFGVIRLSLPRVEERESKYVLTVGTPMPIETRIDTTGSMGGNVDVAMRVMPDAFSFWQHYLKDYDIQVATGIFGDVTDSFPLCRPQFEMHADKIAKQLSLMVPERQGNDAPEDPDLGIFGGAYLLRAYIHRIGLKSYDFTVTDAPGRGKISEKQLERVFGNKVFEKIEENGHKVDCKSSIELSTVWNDLKTRSHAFVLIVGSAKSTLDFWYSQCGKRDVVCLPGIEFLPHTQAVIVGLTEGILDLDGAQEFLLSNNMSKTDATKLVDSLVDIPLGAQTKLPNFKKRPMKGDVFAGKPNVWSDENIWPMVGGKVSTAVEESEWL